MARPWHRFFPPAQFHDPPWTRNLFGHTQWSPLWLLLRLYLGVEWLQAGWGKVRDPAWMQGGDALRAFWERAVQEPDPPARAPIAFDWYRDFIQALLDGGHYSWFAPVIAVGEVLVGLALILGAFTAIAAFFGAFMNWNFIMAGTASTNAVLFLISIFLILAWKTAGYLGLDRWLLPWIGTPWEPGRVFQKEE